jgi:hypothetical protein
MLALLLLAIACAPVPEGAELADFPAARAVAECDWTHNTCEASYGDYDDCVNDYTEHYAGVFSEEACDGWDPALAADCLAEIEARDCEGTTDTPSCAELSDLCR